MTDTNPLTYAETAKILRDVPEARLRVRKSLDERAALHADVVTETFNGHPVTLRLTSGETIAGVQNATVCDDDGKPCGILLVSIDGAPDSTAIIYTDDIAVHIRHPAS